jgi:hypothetical protein
MTRLKALEQIAGAGTAQLVIRESRRLSLEDMIRFAGARPNLVFFEGL